MDVEWEAEFGALCHSMERSQVIGNDERKAVATFETVAVVDMAFA